MKCGGYLWLYILFFSYSIKDLNEFKPLQREIWVFFHIFDFYISGNESCIDVGSFTVIIIYIAGLAKDSKSCSSNIWIFIITYQCCVDMFESVIVFENLFLTHLQVIWVFLKFFDSWQFPVFEIEGSTLFVKFFSVFTPWFENALFFSESPCHYDLLFFFK